METRIGDYVVAGRLGSGGQGVVYDAYDPDGRRVAVKVLYPGESRDRLAKEAAAARRVASFCTAKVLAADLTGGRPYIVSEYVAGPSLRRAVREGRTFGGDDLHRLATAVATALTSIHDCGVVHRDLKPDNVLLGPDGPRVIDFGIARTADMSLTRSGVVSGTPGYMAPEVLTGQRAGPAADVFAWGAVMVFAATGEDPFGGENVSAVMHRVLSAQPDVSGLPEPVRSLVRAALAKDPEARPTARDLLLALVTGGAADTAELLAAGRRAAAGVLAPAHDDPSLGTLAEDAYAALAPQEREHAARVFLRLVAMGERGATAEELGPEAEPVLRAFGYLVSTDDEVVVLARPAIVHAWPRLREWVKAEGAGLDRLAEISAAARAWDDHGRRDGDLLRGSLLEDALTWAATGRTHATLISRERDFLRAATGLTRRQTRRRRALTVALAALLAVALAAAGIAVWQGRQAQDQRDLATGRQVAVEAARLRTTDPVKAMLLNVAGWRLAPGAPTRAGLTEALQAPERSVFRLPAVAGAGAVAAGGNGRVMAGVGEQGVHLYDVPTGRMIASWSWPAGQALTPSMAALSPAGRILVVASQTDQITAWDARSGRKLGERSLGEGGELALVRFGDHESLVALGRGTSVHALWDTLSGRTYSLIFRSGSDPATAPDAPHGPLISADGAHFAAVHINELRLVRLPGMTVSDRVPGKCGSVATFSPDGRRLLCANGDITSYDLATGRRAKGPYWQISGLDGMNGGGLRSAGKMTAAYSGDTITVWAGRTRVLEHKIDGEPQEMWLDPDGATLRYQRDDTIVTLDLRSRLRAERLPQPLGRANPYEERAPGDRVRVIEENGTLAAWDIASGRTLWTYTIPAGWMAGWRTFGPDGGFHVVGLEVADPVHHRDRLVRLDTATGKVLDDRMLDAGLGHFVVAADGTTLVSPTGVMLDLRTGGKIGQGFTTGSLSAVAASPAGPLIAVSGSQGTITLWDLRRRMPLSPSLQQTGGAGTQHIAFSPDGAMVAAYGSTFEGGVVDVWDTATMTRLAAVPVDDGSVEHLRFTADATLRMTTDRTVVALPLDGDRLALAVCRRAGRDLTPAEWERHLPGVPPRPVC
ncbi:Serine/threonine protein kinase [Nonomuraea solani]|uniref:Serine/threonine protein kinase n=1 Tax=Nonomuraea solani TaxID=1144553 RepID=A0A1H5Y3A5_9ACTN|nr:WD40 repeat domain-containing serine/threonine protein kinase [Nonomuraea solani]SEG18265.1 Serine/threonine protein kinase [Nonomuraea solani]